MKRRDFLAGGLGAIGAGLTGATAMAARRKPNFVVILCDDLGFGDIGPTGGRQIKTPHLDRMAAEGLVLTDFYAAANVCTPSRAGLLTGRYPIRTGLGYKVILQNDTRGLPASEVTIPQALKPDYVSGLFGKWHLGHTGDAWPPTRRGFDAFFGLPYSHDMKPLALYTANAAGDLTQEPVDYPSLQQSFYAHAERFMEDNASRPFFLELALSAPHLPEYPRAPFKGGSAAGDYGDVVAEIDSIVGRLLAKLKALDLDRDTLVIFTSDNGPWYEGSSGGLRERKGGGAYDGASRVPCIICQPGVVPAGKRSASIASAIDLLPTFCAMAGVPLPKGVVLDGKDLTSVITRQAPSPHDYLALFESEEVVGVRTQRWSYVDQAYYSGRLWPINPAYPQLYDVQADPTQSYSLASRHPEALAQMRAYLAAARAEFGPLKAKEIPAAFQRSPSPTGQ